MTRSTLKALWLGGGGLLATWLAVSPSDTGRGRAAIVRAGHPEAIHEATVESLVAQQGRLRERGGHAPLAISRRNPFRFGSTMTSSAPAPAKSTSAPAAPAPVPVQPALTLSGIAERKTPQGSTRTAIISGDGQLYLVTEGEIVAGRYRVVTVDGDAVTLRDDTGAELRLAMK